MPDIPRLVWTAEWHVRDETYTAALAAVIDAHHAHPVARLWGPGDTSSSDGQFFRAGGHGEARSEISARYSSDPGVLLYTHISDRYAPFHTKVIAATAGEAAHVLDGLLRHESQLETSNYRGNFARAAAHRHWWRCLCSVAGGGDVRESVRRTSSAWSLRRERRCAQARSIASCCRRGWRGRSWSWRGQPRPSKARGAMGLIRLLRAAGRCVQLSADQPVSGPKGCGLPRGPHINAPKSSYYAPIIS